MTATTPLNANLEANVEAKTRLKKCRYSYCSHSKAWIVLAWGVVSVPGLLVNYRFHRLTDSERPSSGFLREPARRRRYKESVVQPAPLSELTQSIRTPCWGVANAFTNETDPMIWIENNERPLDTSKRIPNIIHQTSRARCLYFKFQQLSQPWRDLTTHSYYFHDDAAVWKLIDRHWPEFPNVRHVARCLNSMTAVSDVWRLLVLWQYGGIYSDLDSSPNAWTPDSILPEDDAYLMVEQYGTPSQYWLAVSPKHPFIYYSIHRALINTLQLREIGNMDASLVTGPQALLEGFQWFMRDVGVSIEKPLLAGLYQGRYNRSIRLVGQAYSKNSDNVIYRSGLNYKDKKMIYNHAMNMTHFGQMKRKWRVHNRTCLSAVYDLTIGPPAGFHAGKLGPHLGPPMADAWRGGERSYR